MNIFYTTSYIGNGKIYKGQKRVSDAARELGFRELPIYVNEEVKDSIEQFDLGVQMDGSFSSFTNEGVLILQYPCGGGLRYDKSIIDHARMYHGAVVIVYNHNANYEDGNGKGLTEEETDLFNSVDLVVDAYRLEGFDEKLLTKKELLDAVLAATYAE